MLCGGRAPGPLACRATPVVVTSTSFGRLVQVVRIEAFQPARHDLGPLVDDQAGDGAARSPAPTTSATMLAIGTSGGLPSGNSSPTQLPYAAAGDWTVRSTGRDPYASRISRDSPYADVPVRNVPARASQGLISAPGLAWTPAGHRLGPQVGLTRRRRQQQRDRDEAGAEDHRQRLAGELGHRPRRLGGRGLGQQRVGLVDPPPGLGDQGFAGQVLLVGGQLDGTGRRAADPEGEQLGRIGGYGGVGQRGPRGRGPSEQLGGVGQPAGRLLLGLRVLGRASDIGHVQPAAGHQQAAQQTGDLPGQGQR